MKKIFSLVAAALISISVSAQSEAGSITIQPNVGISVASATGVLVLTQRWQLVLQPA